MDAAHSTRRWDHLVTVGREVAIRPPGCSLRQARLEAVLIADRGRLHQRDKALIPARTFALRDVLGGWSTSTRKRTRRSPVARSRRMAAARRTARRVSIDLDVHRIAVRSGRAPADHFHPAWREQVPSTRPARCPGDERHVEPTRNKHIALAFGRAAFEPAGSQVAVEITVEGRRGRAPATVVPLPFFDPPRKRA